MLMVYLKLPKTWALNVRYSGIKNLAFMNKLTKYIFRRINPKIKQISYSCKAKKLNA